MSESKLFLFAIGGTGARVLRSLTMLLAAGVRIPGCDRLVPVLIDPDTQNGDMNRTVELLKRYGRIHASLYADGQKPKTGFFSQPLSTLAELNTTGAGQLTDSFVYDFGGINKSFKDYVGYNELSVEGQGLTDLLFTSDSLAANLDVGFRGSPNVGSVVLNALVQSKEMKYLAASLTADDRVFFVSSIFGGTGAAGFPLLVKNLRDAAPEAKLPQPNVRTALKAGALVMLPYFRLDQPSAAEQAAGTAPDFINSDTFLTKTKTALSYYADNLRGLDALYYLGDVAGPPLPNHPGRAAQRNRAHVLELFGALAAVHFAGQPAARLDGQRPGYHEFGLRGASPTAEFDFSQFPQQLRDEVAQPLIRLHYFARYYLKHTPTDTSATYFRAGDLAGKLDNAGVLRDLKAFFAEYNEWLTELDQNQRRFAALRPLETSFNKMVADKTIATSIFNGGLTPDRFASLLSEAVGKAQLTNPTDAQALRWVVDAFEKATATAVQDKLQYS
ncbi:hypothetical protein [Hymenobacter siberiensis]|uniref:hypothetical protein n=1 Tax=Hymenobacter siberiensis TaxID=2848396 RepID=UPI001C1E3D08|nr:hypothetical protein [Hymenobacter siberiensis]MBU6120724.1 hypothetical protein [Hymenobacter siberiensis]